MKLPSTTTLLLIAALGVLLSSCYTRKKAAIQHGRAVTTFPEIGAEFCAITYPPHDSLIKGDSITRFDTIYTGGNTSFDTTIVMDTRYITKTVQLPGTKIIERTTVHDTLVRVNDAEVKLWQIRTGDAIGLAKDKTAESEAWKRKAKRRFWIILGMGAVIAFGVFGFVRKRLSVVK